MIAGDAELVERALETPGPETVHPLTFELHAMLTVPPFFTRVGVAVMERTGTTTFTLTVAVF